MSHPSNPSQGKSTVETNASPLGGSLSVYAVLAGAVWGLALARTLALEMHLALLSGPVGVSLLTAICAGLALGFSRWRAYTTPPAYVAIEMTPLLLPLYSVLKGDFALWRGPVLLTGSLGLVLFLVLHRRINALGTSPRPYVTALAIGLPLLVMLPDVSPYVGRADTFEFQVVAPRLGIAHPSGYPLYILVGKLFSLLPVGTVAWRVNLSSAVFTAVASGVLYLTLAEVSTQMSMGAALNTRTNPTTKGITTNLGPATKDLVGLIVALTMAFSPTLWSRSIEAEVYALNALIVALSLRLAVRWALGKLPLWHAMPAFALLAGLALASHLTLGALLFIGAPLLLTSRPRPSFRLISSALGLFAAGVGLYLYIPIRWPVVNHGEIMTLAHFLRFVTNAESGGALRPLAFIQDPARWEVVLRLIQAQVGWIGILLAVVGLVYLALSTLGRRKGILLALGTALAFGSWVWFNLSFYVAEPDYSAFLIPGHVVLIFWLGLGAMGALDWVGRPIPAPYRYPFRIVIVLLLAYLPLSRLWRTGPTLNTLATGYADEAWGRYVLGQPLASEAAILADSEKFPPLYYLQQIEGLRPDLALVTHFNEAQYRATLQERLAEGQTVYLARYLPGMGVYAPQSLGPLVEIKPDIQAGKSNEENPMVPEARFGHHLLLQTYQLARDPEGRNMHHLTLVWRATHTITEDLEVRLRWVTQEGAVAWELKGTRPVNGYTTTQSWRAGDVITDYHTLPWPQWLTPGTYTLELGLFPRFQAQGLPVTPEGATSGMASQDWLAIAPITLKAPHSPQRAHVPLPQRINAQWQKTLLGDTIWLNSADTPTEATANATTTLDLAWKGRHSIIPSPRILNDVQPLLRWVPETRGAQDASVTPLNARGNPYPTTDWPRSNRFLQTPSLPLRYNVPTPDEAGHYHIAVGWVDQAGEGIPGRCTWLGSKQPFCPLGEILIQPDLTSTDTSGAKRMANFGDKILLTGAELGTTHLTPGGTLPLMLQWRGLRTIDRNYTVFVQLIGPDGKLHGQVDTWPSHGTRPTRDWSPGETIDDAHTVPLAPEAPAGAYRVIVGWYLLATMERLPTVNAAGEITGDFYTIGEITVP